MLAGRQLEPVCTLEWTNRRKSSSRSMSVASMMNAVSACGLWTYGADFANLPKFFSVTCGSMPIMRAASPRIPPVSVAYRRRDSPFSTR